MSANQWIGFVLVTCIGALTIWGAFNTQLLKDDGDENPRPYSYSRSQLLWWTAIISLCIALHYGFTGAFIAFSDHDTAFYLLGISAVTSGIAKVIDQRQNARSDALGIPRSQDYKSEGWLMDVLSDNQGVSIHRFQGLVFNFMYGVLYVSEFIKTSTAQLPQFDQGTLMLLGVSAAAYSLMKNSENPVPSDASGNASGSNDNGYVG